MQEKNTKPLTNDEIETVTRLLSRQPAGFLPLPLFLQVMRLAVASIVEVVPLRITSENTVQVLLLKRDDDYGLWPDTMHTPGVVIRPTDREKSYEDAFGRIFDGELKGIKAHGAPQFVCYTLHKSKRGMENALVFCSEIVENSGVGMFFETDNLPENLMESQRDFIVKAADYFKKTKLQTKS